MVSHFSDSVVIKKALFLQKRNYITRQRSMKHSILERQGEGIADNSVEIIVMVV